MSEKQIKNCILKMVVKSRQNNESPTYVRNPESDTSHNGSSNQTSQQQNDKSSPLGINQLATLLQQILKSGKKEGHQHQIQPRDIQVLYPLPDVKDNSISKGELELWIYKMCKEVISCSFFNFEKGLMSYDQAKIYCSENILSNIVRLAQIAKLTEEEITIIDNQLKKNVLDYMLSKYPMTETLVVNKKIESIIKVIDNMEALQNDAFYHSQNSFDFQYRENGNYNDLIMKLMNHMMSKVDTLEIYKSKKMRIFQHFYDTMQKFFELVEKKDWIEKMEIKAEEDYYSLTKKVSTIEDIKFQNYINPDKDSLKKINDQKYQNHVKSYTHFLIGRKVSQNVPTYTQSQIKSGHLIIKHPAVLRILTKWCDELWSKFDTKNYFLEKSGHVKTLKGGNINTYFAWMKRGINTLIQQEKVEINRFIDELVKNNYDQQAIHLFRSLKANSFTNIDKIQRAAGLFAVNNVENLHSYIILYLNRVIHGLLSVSKKYYDKELAHLARWISPPNLISFKVSDLMRCKISSKEKEIYCLFKYLLEVSEATPDNFKIVRIKNRLKEGTNDILLNIRFNKTHICEMQLAINSDQSNFIKCSNKFNHYIYELKRSIFGPLTQLCSIWISLDGRAKIYQKMAKTGKIQSQEYSGGCQSKNKEHSLFSFNRPFVCNLCNQSFSHSNFIFPHQRCEDCGVFSKCARCSINNQNEELLKNRLFKGYEPYKRHATKRKQNEDIPKFGICFLIESKHLQMQIFVKLQIDGKVAIYTKEYDKIDMITELASTKDIQNFKHKYIIFKLSRKMGKHLINLTDAEVKNQYILPDKMKKIYTKEQEQISLINEGITDAIALKILNGSKSNLNKIKNIGFEDNKLNKLEVIINYFPFLQVLSVSRNRIHNIDGISKLKKLNTLNIRQNQITQLPPQLFTMTQLKKLNIRGNKFKELPEQLSNLVNLQKLEANQLQLKSLPQNFSKMVKILQLDLSDNQLQVFPEQIRGLTNLKVLRLSKNKIQVVPEWIENFSSLTQMKLDQNKISNLPSTFQKLTLETVHLDSNNFDVMSFAFPKSLKQLSIKANKISEIHQACFENGVNLRKIDLKANKLKSVPSSLGFCKNVWHLDLANNQLHTLPQSMIQLVQLESLCLTDNRFTQFPKSINNCHKLVVVEFSKNPLKYVDPIFFNNCFKLQKFVLSFTSVNLLANSLGFCNALRILQLQSTSILAEGLQLLRQLKYIEELNLSNMNIEKLPQAIKELHYLQTFNISHNKIQSFDQDFFKKLTHLKTFTMQNNKIGEIPESFNSCRRIKEVDFSDNSLQAFPKAFYAFTNVQTILINGNKISRIDTDSSVPKSLKKLELKNNGIEFISDIFFKYADNLQKLILTGNKLTEVPINLKNCQRLTTHQLDINVPQFSKAIQEDEDQSDINQQQLILDRRASSFRASQILTKMLMR